MMAETVQVDRCSIQFEVRSMRAMPPRGFATIMTTTEELQSPPECHLPHTPTKFEVVEVRINPAIYEILRDSQTRRFFNDHSISSPHDPVALTAMNKALAELVIECGEVHRRITEKGEQ